MMSNYQLRKTWKIIGVAQKLGQSGQKWEKLVKIDNIWYLHFETKKYIKKYKIMIF